MNPDSPREPPLSRPALTDRHNAMLREMGVNVWWDAEAPAASEHPAPLAPTVAAPPAPVSRATPPHPAPAVPSPADTWAPAPAPSAVPVPSPVALPVLPVGLTDTAALDAHIRACQACGLCRGRQQAVPGVGDLSPDWLIVGEAPGEEEDRQGLPFVGRAGQLLDRMLHAMGLERGHKVYITNVVKCRPPQNRNPDPQELAQCTPYLLQQLDLLRPRMVLAMGRFAAQTLLAQGALPPEALRTTPLGKLRGQVHQIRTSQYAVPVVVTYHPAYLLRTPADKGKAWADLCLAMEALERAPAVSADSSGAQGLLQTD